MSKELYKIDKNVIIFKADNEIEFEKLFFSETFNNFICQSISNGIITEIKFYSMNLNLLSKFNIPSNGIKKIECHYYTVNVNNPYFDTTYEFNNLPESLEELNLLFFGKLKIKNLLNLPPNLKIVKLGKSISNILLDNLPNKLEHFEISTDGTVSFEYLPSSLLYLKIIFEEESNVSLDSLPSSLETLIIVGKYTGQLNNLPFGLKKLYVPNNYDWTIFNLPTSITELMINLKYTKLLDLFDNANKFKYNLKILKIGYQYNQHSSLTSNFNLESIPSTVEELEFGDEFNQELKYLPKNLKKLIFGFNFKYPIGQNVLPDTIEHLVFRYNFNNRITRYPDNLKYLKFGRNYSQRLDNLPAKLIHLVINERFHEKIQNLPPSLRILEFDDLAEFNEELELPDSLEILILGKYFRSRKLKNIPNGLKKIKISNSCGLVITKLLEHNYAGEIMYYPENKNKIQNDEKN
jgi:hypothetical protein